MKAFSGVPFWMFGAECWCESGIIIINMHAWHGIARPSTNRTLPILMHSPMNCFLLWILRKMEMTCPVRRWIGRPGVWDWTRPSNFAFTANTKHWTESICRCWVLSPVHIIKKHHHFLMHIPNLRCAKKSIVSSCAEATVKRTFSFTSASSPSSTENELRWKQIALNTLCCYKRRRVVALHWAFTALWAPNGAQHFTVHSSFSMVKQIGWKKLLPLVRRLINCCARVRIPLFNKLPRISKQQWSCRRLP